MPGPSLLFWGLPIDFQQCWGQKSVRATEKPSSYTYCSGPSQIFSCVSGYYQILLFYRLFYVWFQNCCCFSTRKCSLWLQHSRNHDGSTPMLNSWTGVLFIKFCSLFSKHTFRPTSCVWTSSVYRTCFHIDSGLSRFSFVNVWCWIFWWRQERFSPDDPSTRVIFVQVLLNSWTSEAQPRSLPDLLRGLAYNPNSSFYAMVLELPWPYLDLHCSFYISFRNNIVNWGNGYLETTWWLNDFHFQSSRQLLRGTQGCWLLKEALKCGLDDLS